MQKSNKYKIQKGQFSQQSSSQGSLQLSSKLIQSYNRQYSLIYKQIQTFLKQCKQNIFKFVSLNQFGVGFNLGNLWAKFGAIQHTMINNMEDVKRKQYQNKIKAKFNYQNQFQLLLQRMQSIINDFLMFQLQFKRQYFGMQTQKTKQSEKPSPLFKSLQSSSFKRNSSQNSYGSGSFRRKIILNSQDSQKQQIIEEKLRQILKSKLVPEKQYNIKFCDKQSDPLKNISRLQQKLDMMQSQIILGRTRQEKIIQIFSKKRIQNIIPKGHHLVHNQLIQSNDLNSKEKQQEQRNQAKESKFIKPSLDMQAVNFPKYQKNQATCSSTIYQPVKSPKILSPRNVRNFNNPVIQGQTIQTNHVFYNSPKNSLNRILSNHKSPVNFKKKKVQQQQTNLEKQDLHQNININKNTNIHINNNIEIIRCKNKDIEMGTNKDYNNKNRIMFMRMRSLNKDAQYGQRSCDQ